ncbi:DMT family transporter [Ruixingdingia sedimenti]|uniref:DMT family transporter n=1 Tax=Ruixingdingia sedimenti TaxID=3073604 RepID=A0ABU1F5X8_9RHOB|nr:DMT family transporter [Xinfangfangia sp. LG-4]MDR5652244.1 DMT family transporter [Xinfangfangia sp. LG-4]
MTETPAPITQNRPLEGVLWMLAAGLTFVAVNGTVRWLGTDLPAAQSAFLRFAFGVVILLPTLAGVLRAGVPRGAWPLVAGRGAIHTVAVICWFYAMARLPVAEVTAIGFLNPVCVTLGAVVFFGEKLAFRRIVAVLVALLGALIVLRPGLREIEPGHLAQLLAAICFGGSYLFAKRLSQMVGAATVVALMSLSVTLGLLPFALAAWVPVTPTQLAALAVVAGAATVGHYCMTRAFIAAPMAVTQPVTFLQLIWASLLGVLAFAEPVDLYVLLGGGVMIAAISYITWRETVLRGRAVTPPPDAPRV